jgi:hypothetical protein
MMEEDLYLMPSRLSIRFGVKEGDKSTGEKV